MAHVCPWWHAYSFDHAGRRLVQKPERLLAPYLHDGMTALDLGCGMGFYAIPMARLVGARGRIIAVDLQQRMLDVLMRRAARKGVVERIQPHRCAADSLGLEVTADFALAMWLVHEVPNQAAFAREVRACLKPGARLLVAEPKLHVSRAGFRTTIGTFAAAGLRLIAQPRVGLSRAAVFERLTKE